jgi:hypothetical protein
VKADLLHTLFYLQAITAILLERWRREPAPARYPGPHTQRIPSRRTRWLFA